MTARLLPVPGMLTFVADVTKERRRQLVKWGPQKHGNGTGVNDTDRYFRDDAIHDCQAAAADGNLTWRLILAEEIAEAFAEVDPTALRYELIQAAAVIQGWLADIDSEAKR